jgi:hypothetical protein
MTEEAPAAGYHNDTPTWYGGGTVGDTKKGSKLAGKKHANRMDCNGQCSKDGYPVNAHGWPWKPKFLGSKGFGHYTLRRLKLQIPGLRDAKKTFKQNKKYGIKVTEWEVKDFDKKHSDMDSLVLYMQRLKADAQAVWGDNWRKHVVVKCLTDLAGGYKYCVKVLKAAHRVGFPTMMLCRGEHAKKVINKPWLDYNRGGRVK